MNKNGFILLSIIIVIIIGIIYFTMDTPTIPTIVERDTIVPTESVSTSTPVITATSTATSIASTTIHTITYTETGFSPTSITINAGDTIIFKNNSARGFWPASNNHPSHAIYPELDSKKTITAGESWNFTFTEVGSWKYHDHRSNNLGGTIVVQ